MSEVWNDETRNLARTEAQRWLGTPHRDRIARVGVGIDCINFVYEVLAAAGVAERKELGSYDTNVGLHEAVYKLKRAVLTCLDCEEMPPNDPQFGDIVIFKEGAFSGHAGIIIDSDVWHALAGRCVTRSLYGDWQRKVECLLRIKSLGLKGEPAEAAKL